VRAELGHTRIRFLAIGGVVLAQAFAEAEASGGEVRVGALRESDSNRFYVRNGFVLVDEGEFDNYYVWSKLIP
jgi:hypothetical protein